MQALLDESRIRARVFDVIRKIIDVPPLTGSTIRNARKDWLKPPPLTQFKGIDPIALYCTADDWIFDPKDCTPLVVWPIDVCTVHNNSSEFGIVVQRFRSVLPKDVRGYASRISPFMLRHDFGAEDRGKFVTTSGLLAYLGGRWPDAQKRVTYDERSEIPTKDNGVSDGRLDNGGIAIAIALRQRYEWAVNIGFEKAPSVRIVTDPTGLKELFRLREVADGRDRRDSLMTWVSDHWRKERRDDDVEVYVRKHLRGARKFEWRGMECEIVPSQYDLEQRDKLLADRVAMRTAGIDKRAIAV
jgi:hypothetical protein